MAGKEGTEVEFGGCRSCALVNVVGNKQIKKKRFKIKLI